MSQKPHFLIVTFPAQGHINPSIQFAKHLIRNGALVTIVTGVDAAANHRATIKDANSIQGLSYSFFDGDFKQGIDKVHFFAEFQRRGSKALSHLIARKTSPFTCVIYTLLNHWAVEVAREHNLPYALLWVQPATVFTICFHYFNGHGYDKNFCNSIKLPGVPILSKRELPSYILPSDDYSKSNIRELFKKQIDTLCDDTNPIVLVNTFDTLEPIALNSIERVKMIGIGPLIPSAFLDGKDRSDTSFGADMFKSPVKESYIAWLDSKPKNSVVYVSFGSVCVLSERQQEELARGLSDSNRPFLFVVRETKLNGEDEEGNNKTMMNMSCRDELEEHGLIVPWCSQVEVLSHGSVGCFLTHCGWNSSLESLVCGVPVVAFPQSSDQLTNAKLIEDVWKTGVRVTSRRLTTEDEEELEIELVCSDEIKRCLEKVMGGEGEELRRNATKWRHLGKEATMKNGSSDKNLKFFVESYFTK